MIPFGVTFYPDQWPRETWEKTFREIKAAGFNVVRFNEMAWDWIEPEPGRFNFKELDEALDVCQRHGLKVLLGIPTSQVPTWFFRKFPNSQPVAQDGTKYPEYGPRPNICKDNPNYKKLALRLASQIARRYRHHPALLFWQIDNEPVYPPLDHTTSNDYCHCLHSRHAFINWAKKKYGSIKKLNEVWGAKFWTTSFARFEDIQTPKAGIWEAVSPHIYLDWQRFKTDSLRGWVSQLAKLVRSLDSKHKVGTNGFIGICTRVPDHSILVDGLDWYGLDVYPKGGKMDERAYALSLDIWRSFTRGTRAEFHITELQGGQNVRWGSPEYVEGAEIKEWTEMAFQHGAKALLYHAWRPPLFGAETGGFGILTTDGRATKRLEVIKALAKEILNPSDRASGRDPKSEILNKSKTLSPKIAIAYLRNSEVQTFQEQGPPRGVVGQWETARADIGIMHQLDSIHGAHMAVYPKHKVVDVIFERELDSGDLPYTVILMPNPYLLSTKQYANIKKWIAAGGKLITEGRFGQKDENGHLYEKPLLDDLLGVTFEYVVPTAKGFFVGLEGKAKKEQIITKKIGKGKVVYANFSLFLQIRNGNKKWLRRYL